MKTKKITTILILTFLTASAATQTQTATVNLQSTLINTDPIPVQSGEDAEINFKVRNMGNTEAQDVQVRIIDSFPFSLKPDRQRNYSLGDVVPGQEYQISTEVLVAENAPDGQNSFKVEIKTGDFSVIKEVPVQVQSEDIELNLANLKTTPSQLTPDLEDAKTTIELVNNGEKTAENVVLNIGLPESFQETSSFSTRQAVGNIAPGEVKSAEFNFDIEKTAESGEITIPTNITYSTGESSQRIREETSYAFYLAGRPQFKVTNVESNLKTGETGEVRVTVRNTGDVEASSSRIRVLDSSDLPFSYRSSSQYIGTLQPGVNGTAVFEVTAESDAEPKKYLLDFEIRGVKDTKVYVEDETLQLQVSQGRRSSSLSLPLIAVALLALGGVLYIFRDRLREFTRTEEEE